MIKELSEMDTLVHDLAQPLSRHETKQLVDLFLKNMKLKNFCPEARDNLKLWKSLLKWDSKPFSDFFKQLVKELAKASDHIALIFQQLHESWFPKMTINVLNKLNISLSETRKNLDKTAVIKTLLHTAKPTL